jgi:hypothetical protein
VLNKQTSLHQFFKLTSAKKLLSIHSKPIALYHYRQGGISEEAEVTRAFEQLFQPLGPTAPAPPLQPEWSYKHHNRHQNGNYTSQAPYAPAHQVPGAQRQPAQYAHLSAPERFSVGNQQIGFVSSDREESDVNYKRDQRERTLSNLQLLRHPDFKQGTPEESLVVDTG